MNLTSFNNILQKPCISSFFNCVTWCWKNQGKARDAFRILPNFKVELLVTKGFQLLTAFGKSSILDVLHGSEYASKAPKRKKGPRTNIF